MSEYQAAIAYRPQGVDREYEAAKERAAAKRFSGPQYQYYNEQSHKKRRPKDSPRKAQQQKSSLPPMFPDILPWRDVVPQPLNSTGKKMPKLDFCGEPIEKGRGFDGTIKHWGVPTKNQDNVPFLEVRLCIPLVSPSLLITVSSRLTRLHLNTLQTVTKTQMTRLERYVTRSLIIPIPLNSNNF